MFCLRESEIKMKFIIQKYNLMSIFTEDDLMHVKENVFLKSNPQYLPSVLHAQCFLSEQSMELCCYRAEVWVNHWHAEHQHKTNKLVNWLTFVAHISHCMKFHLNLIATT